MKQRTLWTAKKNVPRYTLWQPYTLVKTDPKKITTTISILNSLTLQRCNKEWNVTWIIYKTRRYSRNWLCLLDFDDSINRDKPELGLTSYAFMQRLIKRDNCHVYFAFTSMFICRCFNIYWNVFFLIVPFLSPV